MAVGDVFQGQIALTNYGLVSADALDFSLPDSDEYLRYEPLGVLPDTLEAKQRIVLPYRIVALRDFTGAGPEDGGGGCFEYQQCSSGHCRYTCTNGTTRPQWIHGTCWTVVSGNCGGSGGGATSAAQRLITRSAAAGGGGVGGGASSHYRPPAVSPAAAPCIPDPLCYEKGACCACCAGKGNQGGAQGGPGPFSPSPAFQSTLGLPPGPVNLR